MTDTYSTANTTPQYNFANLTVSNPSSYPGYGAVPSLTVADLTYTSGAGIINTPSTWNNSTYGTTAKIVLNGPGADVEINGESLVKTLQDIRAALCIPDRLTRNSQLESEFEELQSLGKQYQELEAKFRDQKRVFDILKTQDQ
jgi:hypothetical protein